jgi:hypothetical protein
MAPSSATVVGYHAQGNAEQEASLPSWFDSGDASREHRKNLLHAIVQLHRRHAEAAQRAPHGVDMQLDELADSRVRAGASRALTGRTEDALAT